ncbi:MAG: hypothetical protein GX876_07170 [Bacteroidales bacterium]|nr:hypothetical protein [Bacteroidales bacterium]
MSQPEKYRNERKEVETMSLTGENLTPQPGPFPGAAGAGRICYTLEHIPEGALK